MTKEINVIEKNREELVELKQLAEQVLTSDVFAEEPEEIQDKFESVYIQIQELLLNKEGMTEEAFKDIIGKMKLTIREVAVDLANRVNIPLSTKENGDIVVGH